LCIDKRTGRLLLRKEDLKSQVTFCELTADAARQTIKLTVPGYSFTGTFTDEPVPPEPPAQTGPDSSQADADSSRIRQLADSVKKALSDDTPAANPFGEEQENEKDNQGDDH
jgi:hypothetical protein